MTADRTRPRHFPLWLREFVSLVVCLAGTGIVAFTLWLLASYSN